MVYPICTTQTLGPNMHRLCLLIVGTLTLLAAEDIRGPADSGVVDVTKPPNNAMGDGRTDGTDAFQRALREQPNRSEVIYLPNGTYLVSKRLMRGGRPDRAHPDPGDSDTCTLTALLGQSRTGAIIRLADASPGFQAPAKPQAVIWTGSAPTRRERGWINASAIVRLSNGHGAETQVTCGMPRRFFNRDT